MKSNFFLGLRLIWRALIALLAKTSVKMRKGKFWNRRILWVQRKRKQGWKRRMMQRYKNRRRKLMTGRIQVVVRWWPQWLQRKQFHRLTKRMQVIPKRMFHNAMLWSQGKSQLQQRKLPSSTNKSKDKQHLILQNQSRNQRIKLNLHLNTHGNKIKIAKYLKTGKRWLELQLDSIWT